MIPKIELPFLKRLTEFPHRGLQDIYDRQKAALLTSLLWARGLALVAVLFLINSSFIPMEEVALGTGTKSVLFAISLNFVALGLSKTRLYKWACLIVVVETTIGITISCLAMPTMQTIASSTIWYGMNTLVCSLILSRNATIASIVFSFISFVILGITIPSNVHNVLFINALYFLTTSGLILIGTIIREKSEHLLVAKQEQIMQNSKFSALGDMAAGVAHEINTPLAVTLLRVEHLLEDAHNNDLKKDEIIEGLTAIEATSKKISKIVLALLHFSRKSPNALRQPTSLGSIITEALLFWEERLKHEHIRLEVDQNLLTSEQLIVCQSSEIIQVISNLLQNSYDAISDQKDKWIKLDFSLNENFVEVSVTDSGEGVSIEAQQKLMQPFFTTKDIGKGTGLGLSVARGIIESNDGQFYFDPSSPNTKFTFTLPLYKPDIKKVA